jgi:hypothetical protein
VTANKWVGTWGRVKAIALALLLGLMVTLCAVVYFWWHPRDRVRVIVEGIPEKTEFLCIFAQVGDDSRPLWWYHEKVGPFTMHPKRDVTSNVEGETRLEATVQWEDANRFGVLTFDKRRKWRVFWFNANEVNLTGRSFFFAGGSVRIMLPDESKAEAAPAELTDQVD